MYAIRSYYGRRDFFLPALPDPDQIFLALLVLLGIRLDLRFKGGDLFAPTDLLIGKILDTSRLVAIDKQTVSQVPVIVAQISTSGRIEQ